MRGVAQTPCSIVPGRRYGMAYVDNDAERVARGEQD